MPTDIKTPLFFALVAERLNGFYSRNQWVGDARAGDVANVWLSRENLFLPHSLKKQLLALSDAFARDLADGLSREAGLHIAHEMMESLDSRYVSNTADQMTAECDRVLRENGLSELG
ncbi:MAG: hypothetical protein ACRYGG_23815 [Janthinobacterium lividum]